MVWGALAAEVTAAPHEESQHPPLPVDPALSLGDVLSHALSRYPAAGELAARTDEVDAWQSRSASALANRPALSFRYQTDRWGDDAGLREYEGGVELPLWRWGERRAARSYAGAMAVEAGAAAHGLRWQVAGLLRTAVWNVAEAERHLVTAVSAYDVAGRLAASVARRHELGDVSLGDVLLARSAHLQAETELLDVRASLLDAQRSYRALTELEARPVIEAEAQSAVAAIVSTHPALALVEAQLAGARARQTLVREGTGGSPTLLIGPRWERPALGSGYDDSIGVTLTVPLAGTSHSRTELAASGREVAAAVARRDQLRRMLTLDLHEAEHGLEVARENLQTATERADLARRHARMGRRAYDQGEMDLMDLLKVEEAAMAAQWQAARLDIEVGRQIAMYNQAVGEMP